jgi:hypothetical protein
VFLKKLAINGGGPLARIANIKSIVIILNIIIMSSLNGLYFHRVRCSCNTKLGGIQMIKKFKKYVIPTLAVTMIGAASTTPIVSADANELYVTAEESKAIALERVPGTVEEVELENEDGFVVYEVEVRAEDGSEHEVIIDARTGEIVAVETDDYDDDNDSDDDDNDDYDDYDDNDSDDDDDEDDGDDN